MPSPRIAADHFSPDIQEFLRLLHQHEVHYVITGGEAVIYHGHARLTGDVDFFYDQGEENARKLYDALNEFWDGDIPDVETSSELTQPGLILQFGRPPNRIDLINQIDGVGFGEAWDTRITVTLAGETGDVPVYYLALAALTANKKAAGRPKDLQDIEYLDSAGDSAPN